MSKIPMFPNKFAILASILGDINGLKKLSNVYLYNNVKHLLLVPQKRNNFSFYIVYATTATGLNDFHTAFIAYSTTSFQNTQYVTIIPLDGRTYTTEDYTYNDDLYKAIEIRPSTNAGGYLNVIGVSSFKDVVVD